jgi:hypothetical protein
MVGGAAALALACCSRVKTSCEVAPPPHLGASAVPAVHELRSMLADAGSHTRSRRLLAQLRYLDQMLDTGSSASQCMALRDARSALGAETGASIGTAEHTAVALVLDLTAARIANTDARRR